MIRKTAKEMKKMKNKKTKPSSEKRDRDAAYVFRRNTNITHSDYCVINSWRLPPKCLIASSGYPTLYLVEIDGKYIWSSSFNLAYKTEASTPYQFCGYNVSVVVTSYCTPAFTFYIRTRSELSKTIENCDIIEPIDSSQYMRFCQIVEFNGRFYAMSLQGSVVVIENEKVDSDRFGITRIGGNRAVPSKVCRQFREYLVKSHGEILVVFLLSRNSIHVVDDVEVFRLDTEKLSWVQVENIGERTFCLGDENGARFEACVMGIKKNCIYFTHHGIDDWMIFDMEARANLPYLDVKMERK